MASEGIESSHGVCLDLVVKALAALNDSSAWVTQTKPHFDVYRLRSQPECQSKLFIQVLNHVH